MTLNSTQFLSNSYYFEGHNFFTKNVNIVLYKDFLVFFSSWNYIELKIIYININKVTNFLFIVSKHKI